MEHRLDALAALLKGRLIGNGAILVRGVNTLQDAQEGEITFADDARRLDDALRSRAAAILVPAGVADLKGRAGISVDAPRLAFATLLELFHPEAPPTGAIHPTAVIAASAQVSEGADVRAHAVIGERARIGRRTVIEPGTVIGDDVTIGEGCLIGPNATLYRRTVIGRRVRIHGGSVIGGDGFGYVFHTDHYVKIPQVGHVVIEDDVEIGCNVCVDRATVGTTLIQRGTKIDNLVQVAHNDRIGRHVVMSGQVGFSGSVTVGDYARFGGKAGVVDHVDIGAQADVGAASVVIKSIPPKQKVWGYPARPADETMRQMAALGRLPGLLKRVTELAARLLRLEQRLEGAGRRGPSRKT